MNTCIVNVAKDVVNWHYDDNGRVNGAELNEPPSPYVQLRAEHYEAGQQRLLGSILGSGYKGGLMFWRGEYPAGSPTHSENPYAFKYYAIEAAFRAGYELVLWLDCSVVVRKPLDPLFDIIRKRGVLVFDNPGQPLDLWTTKDTLDELGLTPEQAHEMTCVCGGIVGYSQRDGWRPNEGSHMNMGGWPKGGTLFGEMCYAMGSEFFTGDAQGWGTDASIDPDNHPSFKAHRHDQSVLTALVYKYGIQREPMDVLRYDYDVRGIDDSVILELRGMPA